MIGYFTSVENAKAMQAMVEGEHVMSDDGWCWCQPRVEHTPPNGELTIHRHFMDRPEYTEADLAD